MEATISDGQTTEHIGDDRLLRIHDVQEILDVNEVTASRVMKESGRHIILHRKVYILESSLLAFLRKKEGCRE